MIVRDMTGCRVICVLRRVVPVMVAYVVTAVRAVHVTVRNAQRCAVRNACLNVRTVTIPPV